MINERVSNPASSIFLSYFPLFFFSFDNRARARVRGIELDTVRGFPRGCCNARLNHKSSSRRVSLRGYDLVMRLNPWNVREFIEHDREADGRMPVGAMR